MESFWSAFLGGLMALAGVFIQGFLQENHQKEVSRKEEMGLIDSIQCELRSLLEIFESRQDEINKGELGEEGFLTHIFPITGNYLAYFDSNYQHFHKLTNKETRLDIQYSVAQIRSYIDSVICHNNLMDEFFIIAKELALNPANNVSKAIYDMKLENLKEYDSILIEQAKQLKDLITKLVIDLDLYRA